MPVSAAVVAVANGTTLIAGLLMSTHGSGTASNDSSQHPALQGSEGFFASELISKNPDHISQAEYGSHALV